MLELGQPTHPYDLDKLPGRGLLVRNARPGETLTTLDGVERRLGLSASGEAVDDCLICDAEGTPVGVGGIMGGASSEITDDTTTVLLEAANFERMAIAWTSKRLGLRSEASARFERGVDVEVIELAVDRFCELIGTGTVAPGLLDDRSGVPDRARIAVRTARVNALLGTDLDGDSIRGYLEPIGFDVAAESGGVQHVLPPSFRPDVEREVDVVEEVARHHGYSNIARTVPRSPNVGGLTPFQLDRRLLRQILVGAGINEAQTPSLLGLGDHERAQVDEPLIEAANAMIQEESILRASLLPGLLRALAFNAARRAPAVSFFEIGMVWHHPPQARAATGLDATLPHEVERVAVALGESDAAGAKRAWDEIAAGLRLASVRIEAAEAQGMHPTRTARLVAGGEAIGVVGEVDPTVLRVWRCPAGWGGSTSTSLVCSTRRANPSSSAPSAASRRPTSTSRSSSARPRPPATSKPHCATPAVNCSSTSASSTCTAVTESLKEHEGWRTASASTPPIARSPTTKWEKCERG
jgi:phenylalanyl-tRNA synthetase beta chain